MSQPSILVVDDQFTHNATERLVFLQGAGLLAAKAGADRTARPYADMVFCSGQRAEAGRLINDYAVVRDAVAGGDWALVLLDVQFDSGESDAAGRPAGQPGDDLFGMTILQQLKADFPDLPVVMLTGKPQGEIGSSDAPYLSKYKLGSHEVRLALLRYGKVDAETGRALLDVEAQVCAEDAGTLAAFRQAFIHARAEVSVLILGESGTGKEVLARHVHRLSGRVGGPFIPVNVAAIPKDLVESELFGIGKRIATGVDARPGKFEQASGGTLFLDEIGDMPMDVQAKVLRALQERKIVRVGEAEAIPVDIRLVCATSRDLANRVATGEFRSDLLYRINTVPITIAPLRERRGDILPLARSFLNTFAIQQKKSGLSLSQEALSLLQEQPYPGNVRQLENLLQRMVSAVGHHQVIGSKEVRDALGFEDELPAMLGTNRRISSEVSRPAIGDIKAFGDPAVSSAEAGATPTCDRGLDALLEIIDAFQPDMVTSNLLGAKTRLDVAYRQLLQRLAGAALERCRNPVDGVINRQKAVQLLMNDASLKGKVPGRVINEILGQRQENPVTEVDLEVLVRQWRAAKYGTVDASHPSSERLEDH